jgi:hypothetical protein
VRSIPESVKKDKNIYYILIVPEDTPQRIMGIPMILQKNDDIIQILQQYKNHIIRIP